MRRLAIFLYFLVMLTVSMNMGEWVAGLLVMGIFLIMFNLAEDLDDEGYKIT